MTSTKLSNSEAAYEAKGLSILFADDERSLQELMKLEFPRMGHRVTVCPDGITAAAALEKDTFDCLLVDLDMPGLSGIDVIAKARDLCPDAEAVVLTGKSSLETAIAALRPGLRAQFPINARDLFAALGDGREPPGNAIVLM